MPSRAEHGRCEGYRRLPWLAFVWAGWLAKIKLPVHGLDGASDDYEQHHTISGALRALYLLKVGYVEFAERKRNILRTLNASSRYTKTP